ncbi:hypothetical protein V5P93_004763 [Actinokineospora auranticolor]|uniref:Uncharacterized protein n=1 Tax=Actinokineospora auranticolor TaxID=155976 RepID=A0A2S6GNH2_9PSEU|nr:hypothetical protein [Actinokineospora auranticolor]PPK66726.1 hypothetical protein CLV40_109111 [Actinokineospora auranticolor]
MSDPTALSVVLAGVAGLVALGRGLGGLDWTGVRAVRGFVELFAGVAVVAAPGPLVDLVRSGTGWAVAVVLVLSTVAFLFGPGLFAGIVTLALIRDPDPVLLTAVVIPLLAGCALAEHKRVTRTAYLVTVVGVPHRWQDSRWRVATLLAPALPVVAVLVVPPSGATTADQALRIGGAVLLGGQLLLADRARSGLLRAHRMSLRASESTLVLVGAVLAASPVGAEIAVRWAGTPALTGWAGYRLLLLVFLLCLAPRCRSRPGSPRWPGRRGSRCSP